MLRIVSKLHSKNLQKTGHVFGYKSVRYQSSKHDAPKSSGGSATLYTIGALTVATGATVAYAKYDPNFRETLVKTVPYSNDIIKFIFQEDSLPLSSTSVTSIYDNVKTKILGDSSSTTSSKSQPQQKEKVQVSVEKSTKAPTLPPPPPATVTLLEKKDDKKSEKKQDDSSKKTSSSVSETKKPDQKLPETHTIDLTELERQVANASNEAIIAYNKAISNLKNYNNEIAKIIDDNLNQLKPQQLDVIRTKTRIKNEIINEVKEKSDKAIEQINKLKVSLTKPELSQQMKETIKNNLQRIQNNLNEIQQKYEQEKTACNITEKYWDKVEKARQHFINELEILFPTINLNEKQLKITQEQLDLFLLHAYSNILFYQKELAKLETVEHEKLQEAIALARRNLDNSFGKEMLTNAQIHEAVEKEKRQLALAFQLQCLKLKKEAENELRQQLKRQSQCFTDHLDEAIQTKSQEIERELSKKFDEQLENERTRYKMQLAAIIGRLKGLDESLKARIESDEQTKQSQLLWSACQSLLRAIKSGSVGLSWKQQLRPLEPEIVGVQKAAAPTDELVKIVVDGIPIEARSRGVFPEDALRERFLKVEKVARQLALIPEHGGSLTLYLLSYLQSFLLIKSPTTIPVKELNDEPTDFTQLTTNEILQRARYWLDRGNFAQTLKYMNLLKGAPRSIAKQWMDETRIMLETQQAADTLMAHAASSGYTHL